MVRIYIQRVIFMNKYKLIVINTLLNSQISYEKYLHSILNRGSSLIHLHEHYLCSHLKYG